jgi:hypothetical protein
MATEILIKNGTPIVWADTTDYNPAAGVIWARTHQLDLTSLATTAAQQGAKADLGATRAAAFTVRLCPEFDVAPASGLQIAVYFSLSKSATAGLDNPGFLTGADAAYTGTTGDSIADSVKLMNGPYVYNTTSDVAPISLPANIGILYATERYVSPVVFNIATGQAFEGDAVEMFLALDPIPDELQN